MFHSWTPADVERGWHTFRTTLELHQLTNQISRRLGHAPGTAGRHVRGAGAGRPGGAAVKIVKVDINGTRGLVLEEVKP